jgi:hypothetical protein
MSDDLLTAEPTEANTTEPGKRKRKKRTQRERRPGDSFTLRDLAQDLGVGVGKIRRWLKRGDLVAINVSDSPQKPMWRVTAASVEAFKQRHSSQPVPQTPRRRPSGKHYFRDE